jgi:hypothetical protein
LQVSFLGAVITVPTLTLSSQAYIEHQTTAHEKKSIKGHCLPARSFKTSNINSITSQVSNQHFSPFAQRSIAFSTQTNINMLFIKTAMAIAFALCVAATPIAG